MLRTPTTEYFNVQKNGLSPFQSMLAYMGGSTLQTIVDNPLTAYRQMVQQYATNVEGALVSPVVATREARSVFWRMPIQASLSGLGPRLVGVGFKRVPKFTILFGISYLLETGEDIGLLAATGASILSAPCINPIRYIEKQQRAYFRSPRAARSVMDILRESAAQNYRPLFRGTIPLMGHSFASASTGLVGQPRLQKYIAGKLDSQTTFGQTATGLLASAMVSPIYVLMTNPVSRLEVIMQTASPNKAPISVRTAIGELLQDTKQNGVRGLFRGQGLGTLKAIVSLTLFHQGRLVLTDWFTQSNR